MAKKITPGQLNLFGSNPQKVPDLKHPLPDSIKDTRLPNPKAVKLYNASPLPSARAIYPIELPTYKILPPTPTEAAYLAQPSGDVRDQAIIIYLINHRQVPWPFSYLRVAAETGLDAEYVHTQLKLWAHKSWYGVRRTTTGTYLAFLYYSEFFSLPSGFLYTSGS